MSAEREDRLLDRFWPREREREESDETEVERDRDRLRRDLSLDGDLELDRDREELLEVERRDTGEDELESPVSWEILRELRLWRRDCALEGFDEFLERDRERFRLDRPTRRE